MAINHTDATAVTFHFGPRFRPSVSALGPAEAPARGLGPPPPQWHHLKYPIVTNAFNCTTFELRSFMFKLLFIAKATRSRGTFGRNMVEYQMVRGETEARKFISNSRENSNLFRASGESTFPTCDFSTFRASVQILFKRGFKKPI